MQVDGERDDLLECWTLLRRSKAESNIPKTMNGMEALERILRVLREFDGSAQIEITSVTEGGSRTKFLWRVGLPGSCPEAKPTIEEAIEAMFNALSETIQKKRTELSSEVGSLELELSKVRDRDYELEKLQKYMGAYEPDQMPLPEADH